MKKTLQSLLILGVAVGLWWLSGKPDVNVSIGNDPLTVSPMMKSGFEPVRAETEQLTVPVDELVERVDPAPTFIVPLAVELRGPRDAMVGDLIDLTTELTGAPTDYEWTVEPPTEGLRVLDGGARAVFSSRDVGDYALFVSVAGQGGQVAHAVKVITLLPQPPENPITASTLPLAQPQVDVSDLVRRWISEVGNASKGEILTVGDTFRQSATLLRGGVVGADPLRDVEAAAEIALGAGPASRWLETFFIRTREFLVPLQATGHLQTAEDFANTFDNMANMIDAVGAAQ